MVSVVVSVVLPPLLPPQDVVRTAMKRKIIDLLAMDGI
jgi:hypothetical protein